MQSPDLKRNFTPIHVRHVVVQQYEVDQLPPENIQTFSAAICCNYLIALHPQDCAFQLHLLNVVINAQNQLLIRRCSVTV